MKRSAPILTSVTPQQQQLEFKSHERANSDLSSSSEMTPSSEPVDKPAQRGAVTVSSSSANSLTSDSIVKQLARIDITPKKRKFVSSYRKLLKERAHSRRKNRMVIIDNKVIKNPSCDSSSCVQAEPLELLNRDRHEHSSK